jgi:hypothetical protein
LGDGGVFAFQVFGVVVRPVFLHVLFGSFQFGYFVLEFLLFGLFGAQLFLHSVG